MSTGSQVRQGRLMAFVRAQTFQPRGNLDLLFIAVEVKEASIMAAWLIPSETFSTMVGEPNNQGRFRFSASIKLESKDRWTPYRVPGVELPQRILDRLAELEQGERSRELG